MKISVIIVVLVGCGSVRGRYSDRYYRDVDEPVNNHLDNWFNTDEDLPLPDTPPTTHINVDLHLEIPQTPMKTGKMVPTLKNPMWIDKMAIIKPPAMCPFAAGEKRDSINYGIPMSLDQDSYEMPKVRQRRSAQQSNKKSPRNSEKKHKFKVWLEKKLGEKFVDKLGKFKKGNPLSRQSRSVDQNVAADVKTGQKDNCTICGGVNQACPMCHGPFIIGSMYPPRPQFIEIINGEPKTFIPGSQHTTYLGSQPRFIFDQLGHKYLERDGNLQILPPATFDSPIVTMPSSYDYMQTLYNILQRYPHFQTAHRLEEGELTDDPVKQTQDVFEFIKGLTQLKNKAQKRHVQEYNLQAPGGQDSTTETLVDEESLSAILMDQDEEFEKYLEKIGYTGEVEVFDGSNYQPENTGEPSKPLSESIFYDNSMKTANKFQTLSPRVQHKHHQGQFRETSKITLQQ
ncbi:hypothetical protein DMENIID0001_083630 [Sergentomyia squamirostris]